MRPWRTMHKRAARRRKRDQEFIKNLPALCDEIMMRAVFESMAAAFQDLGRHIEKLAFAWGEAMRAEFERPDSPWKPLAREYQRLHEWPEVIYEDILDADEIG